MTVEAVCKGEATVSCKGRTRRIFLVRTLQQKLLDYIKRNGLQTGSVFVTKNGNNLDRSNIWREMKLLCHSAGIPKEKVFPHNLRHLFSQTFYSIEKDISRLADILGHSSIDTTRIYIMSAGNEHRRCLERMQMA